MTQISTDTIITLISAILGLSVASLSAWFAYLALNRRKISRNDIERSTIESILTSTSGTSLRYVFYGVLSSCFLALNVI